MTATKSLMQTMGPWALGRFSTALKVGLVGLPNVGKSGRGLPGISGFVLGFMSIRRDLQRT